MLWSKFLSLRELRQLFTNSIALTDHVVVFEAIIEKKEQLQIFSWPGPRWSSPGGFLFHCNTWDRHFFYRHKLLTFLLFWAPPLAIAKQLTGCSLEITREAGIGKSRAGLQYTVNSTETRVGHLHKPGPMRSSPGLIAGWPRGWKAFVEGPHARNQPTDRLDQTKRGFTFSTATLACKKGTTPLGTFHPIKD